MEESREDKQTVSTLVVLTRPLLKQLDAEAKRLSMNRSCLIRQLIIEKFGSQREAA